MIKRDYYEVLNIDRTATEAEIKKAYRQLALQCHPDRNREDPEAEEKFKEASEAYEVLSDPQRRSLYDAYGHRGLEGAGFRGFADIDDVFASMGDIFEELFGGMGFGFDLGFGGRTRRRPTACRGPDLRHDLEISFMDAAHGTEQEISVTRQVKCSSCDGSGAEHGAGRVTCKACGGVGHITQRQGFFVLQSACPRCHGQGSVIERYCQDCRGRGRVRKTSKIKVKVPAGIEDGMSLVLRGQGEPGENSGPPGDLYVIVSVVPHQFFTRQGDELSCTVPISFPQAALGAQITVPSLDSGEIEVQVPAGTETGDELRIGGKGLPNVHRRGKRGDYVIRFMVETPKKLSKKQRKLLEEFEKL